MNGLERWKKCCEELKKQMDKAGKASYGTIQGDSVNVEGRLYTYKLAVPMSISDGAKVYVHISNDVAVIIGG